MLYIIKINDKYQFGEPHKAFGPYDPINKLSMDQMNGKIQELEDENEDTTIVTASTTW